MDDRKINQRQLADLIGMDPGYLSHKLNGTKRFTMDEIEAIATALGTKPPRLFFTPDADSIDALLDQAPEEARRAMTTIAKTLLGEQ